MTLEEQERANSLLGELQKTAGRHTDFLLVRNPESGESGHANCIHITFEGKEYTVTCHHVLKPGAYYYTGPTPLSVDHISEQDVKSDNGIPPLQLIADSESLDLALFGRQGLNLATVLKSNYALDSNGIKFDRASGNKGTLSFIFGTPGFAVRQAQYPDGLVYLNTPIYKGYGPIVAVEDARIIADFAEAKLIELTNAAGSAIEDFQPSGGARNLGGMSGSGLWVYCENRFQLAGILRGREGGSDTTRCHIIEFTPVWKLVEWLQSVTV